MDAFEVSSTVNGEIVSLRVSYLGNFPDSNYGYYRISNGENVLSILKINGSCEVEVDSGEIDEPSFSEICALIRDHRKQVLRL